MPRMHESAKMNIKIVAKQWLDANIDPSAWPQDQWAELNAEYAINIYVDDDGKNRATVFPIIDGEIDLETFVEIV